MKAISSLLLAVALIACGKSDSSGGGGSKTADLATPAGVLAEAQARTDAVCACKDPQCRLDVDSKAGDPFLDKGADARAKFTPDQQKTYNDIHTKYLGCMAQK
jgi:hypothetical protein